MCGICGKIDFTGKPVAEETIRRMTAALAHRGPDADGIYLSQRGPGICGLGHRRLSIIDLSAAGRQPMANEDGSLRLVCNGEIYNFQALRRELQKKGHHFVSNSDSEVILHLFEEEGSDAVFRLVGMFAFALWSEKTGTLFLARDHVGIKPLVYYQDERCLLFASEIGALLKDPDVDAEIDMQALDIYLALNYIPAPFTIFKNIRKLEPGHLLTVADRKVEKRCFWDVLEEKAGSVTSVKRDRGDTPGRDGIEETKRVLFKTLEDAVRAQMVADVPLGAFLSGGIDSSVVVGLMARNSDRPIKTWTIGFSDMPMYDETAYARAVANMHQTEHHEIVLESREMIRAVPDVLASLDEPFGDSSVVPTSIVSRETSRDVKVALSGDGGDELFAGYRMYQGEKWLKRYLLFPRLVREKIVEPIMGLLPESRDSRYGERMRRVKKFFRGAKETLPARFMALNELFTPEARKILLKNGYVPGTEASALFARALDHPSEDTLNRMLYADFTVSLPGDMLWKVDKMSMAHALEVRVPLLDPRFCELAFTIGGDWKLRSGKGKYIFIETFRDILPEKLHNRPKWGFEMPIARWLKTDLKYLIDEYLSRKKIAQEGLFSYPEIEKMIADLFENRRDTAWKLWNLIVFQSWYESFRNR